MVNRPLPAACNRLVARSLGETMANMVPTTAFHYACKVNEASFCGGGGASLTCLVQVDLRVGEGMIRTIMRKAAKIGIDGPGIALCKGCRGIARQADELARLQAVASESFLFPSIWVSTLPSGR